MIFRKILFTLAVLIITLPALASSQGLIQISPPTGLWAEDSLSVNGNIVFSFRLTNTTESNIIGYTNGFVVSSNDGAIWDTLVGEYSGIISPSVMEQIFINPFSTDGMGADTIGFGGFSLFTPGIPTGFDEIVWSIEIGPVPASNHGKHICLDTTFYPTTGTWQWSTTGGDAFPEWGGPYCYVFFDPEAPPANDPPVLATITNQEVTEMKELQFTVSAADPNGTIPAITMTSPVIAMGASFTDNGDGTGSFAWATDNFSSGIYDAMFYATDAVDPELVDSVPITITVIDSNLTPFIYIFPFTDQISEGGTVTIDVVFFDLDSTSPGGSAFLDGDDTLATNMVFNTPDSITTAGVYSSLTFNPDFSQGDSDPDFYFLRFRACDEIDETLCSESQPAMIRVLNVNRAPEWVDASIPVAIEVMEGMSIDFAPIASDPDLDPISLSLTGELNGIAGFTDNGDGTGSFSWQTSTADIGSYEATLIVSDGELADTAIIPITVMVRPNPFEFVSVPEEIVVRECDTIAIEFIVNDPEGDDLFLSLDPILNNMTFTDNGDGTALLVFDPEFSQIGNNVIGFMVTDMQSTIVVGIPVIVNECFTGEFSADMVIDPDTIRALSAFAIDPILISIYYGNFNDPHTVADIDLTSLMINHAVDPVATEILDSYDGFTGQVLKVDFRVYDFIQTYGLLFDTVSQAYSLSGQFSDEVLFSTTGDVVFIGHYLGDANLNGRVDISDVTFMIDYYFRGGVLPIIPEVVDMNSDGKLTITDMTLIVKRAFHTN